MENTVARGAGREVEAARARRRIRSRRASDALWGYALVAPLLSGLGLFYLWPLAQTIYFSFTKWESFGRYRLEGLANYTRLVHDHEVYLALRNTVVYTVLTVSVSIVLSILVAVLLNRRIRGVGIYRTLYFLPVVTIPAAVAMIWRWLYNGDYGLINRGFLAPLGIHGPAWVSDPRFALYAIVVVGVWSSIGYNMILFLAGLQSIPSQYYEAAEVDGASPRRRFFQITLPLLTPTTFFVVVISLINSLQVFDLILLMVGQDETNPARESTQSLVYLFFQTGFRDDDKGYAAAISVLLFGLILLVTIAQVRLQKRWVHYGSRD